jgi:uncharacterized metal-binding protein
MMMILSECCLFSLTGKCCNLICIFHIQGWFSLVLLALVLTNVHCQILEGDMPTELVECYQMNANKKLYDNSTYSTSADIHAHCMQLFLWKSANVRWSDFNITEKDRSFINSLIGSVIIIVYLTLFFVVLCCYVPSENCMDIYHKHVTSLT